MVCTDVMRLSAFMALRRPCCASLGDPTRPVFADCPALASRHTSRSPRICPSSPASCLGLFCPLHQECPFFHLCMAKMEPSFKGSLEQASPLEPFPIPLLNSCSPRGLFLPLTPLPYWGDMSPQPSCSFLEDKDHLKK